MTDTAAQGKDRYSQNKMKLAAFWREELSTANNVHDDTWRDASRKVVEKYEGEKETKEANIFWANVEALDSAVFSATPRPAVKRRFLDPNPITREAADVVERALSYCIDKYRLDGYLKQALNDRNVPGIGLIRLSPRRIEKSTQKPIYLEPELITDEIGTERIIYRHEGQEVEPEYDEVGAFVMGPKEDELLEIKVRWETVQWDRMRWETGYACWDDVTWFGIDQLKTRDELRAQFGDIADKVTMTHVKEGGESSKDDKDRALITEVFCKATRRVIVVADSCDEVLEVLDDPYQLEDFYPFPEPLIATRYRKMYAPKADLGFYEKEEQQLGLIKERISALTAQLKYRGVYDKQFPALKTVMEDGDDGQFTPVEDFAVRFGDKGGLENVLATVPLEEIVMVLRELHAEAAQVTQTIYEITGISDIQRGQTDPNETAAAQTLKSQYGGLRIKNRQTSFAQFARDILRLTAEYIVEHLSIDNLSQIVGKPVDPQVYQLLKDDKLRSYAIDIETDSTIAGDQQEEKNTRVEFLNTFAGFVSQLAPMVQTGMMSPDVAKEMVLFVVRAFPNARQIESAIENNPLFMPPMPPPGMPGDPSGGGMGMDGGMTGGGMM